jgi:hypothetical protein
MISKDMLRQGDGPQFDEGSSCKRRRVWLGLLIALCAFLLFLVLFVPTLDVNKRQRGNESATVSRLLRLKRLQDSYAASFPAKGFACQLSQLKSATPGRDAYDQDEFLLNGEQSGYKFAVTGCGTALNGMVTQYQVIAVPVEPGKTGIRAFCTDQTGVIWYDSGGSAEHCFTSRRLLQ